MVFCINHYNRFAYNVSIALICAAINQLVSGKTDNFELINLDHALSTIANTTIRTATADQLDMLYHFLVLFTTFQDVYWFHYDRPVLHQNLVKYIECDWQSIGLHSMLDELQALLNKSTRDGKFTQKQTLVS